MLGLCRSRCNELTYAYTACLNYVLAFHKKHGFHPWLDAYILRSYLKRVTRC